MPDNHPILPKGHKELFNQLSEKSRSRLEQLSRLTGQDPDSIARYELELVTQDGSLRHFLGDPLATCIGLPA